MNLGIGSRSGIVSEFEHAFGLRGGNNFSGQKQGSGSGPITDAVTIIVTVTGASAPPPGDECGHPLKDTIAVARLRTWCIRRYARSRSWC